VKVIEIGPGERIGVGDVSLLTLSHAMQMERRSFELILGTGADARTLVDLTLLAANRNGHLLLWGERGTGHELLARAVHAVSTRRAHSLLTIEEPIAEGAERAVLDSGRRGMVLVDLMATADGRLHRELVSRLLRPEQNARVVVAAESYEHAMASLGTALVAQLHPIHLPALRTRTAEIPELLDRLFRLEGVATVGDLGESNLAGLAAYPWQGDMCANLDELIYASRYLAMRASGLSQTKAAQAVGWSQPTASRREREWGVTFKSDGDGRGDRRRS